MLQLEPSTPFEDMKVNAAFERNYHRLNARCEGINEISMAIIRIPTLKMGICYLNICKKCVSICHCVLKFHGGM